MRDRIDDVILLSKMFIDKYNETFNKHITGFSEEVKDYLLKYNYPGNVRELENIIMSAISMCDDNEYVLDGSHFSIQYSIDYQMDDYEEVEDNGIDEYLSNLEKKIIEKALRRTNNNITKASNVLKIKRQTLQHKIKKYDISIT